MRLPVAISIAFFWISGFQSAAQTIAPPGLNCVTTQPNGDVVLNWSLPNVSCGPFLSYDIYAATSITGPYTLLVSVTNATQTTWTHTGANGNTQTWYYYMMSKYNCPSGTPLPSDTLDNREPEAPVINYVTVVSGKAELSWQPSPSPECRAYIIYRYAGGFNPVDTVYGRLNTTYVDAGSNPGQQPEEYTVAAMDSCGNTGPFAFISHKTIYLTAQLDNCSGFIALNWSSYMQWPLGVDQYSVYYSVNGSPFVLDGTVPGNVNSYQLPFANDQDSICVYVGADEKSGSNQSASNMICFRADILQPAAYTYMYRADVQTDGSVLVEWSPDASASIQAFRILRGTNAGKLTSINNFAAPSPIPPLMSYTDQGAVTDKRAYYYSVSVTDSCGNEVPTGKVRTIHLVAFPRPDFSNFLRWNPYEIEYGTINGYTVYKQDNAGTWQPVAALPDSVTGYADDISDEINEPGRFCYRVEATGTVNYPTGTSLPFIASSNEICVEQVPVIRTPTAMVPEGTNNFFKPVIVFANTQSYLLQIFNRWGEKIFETTDPDQAWDGRYGGDIVPQGVYTFLIRVNKVNGETYYKTGTVMVIR